jgi:type II secretory ATPase GspE/PulE/Tfp pilus assembly ATPase PilB-like protein
VSTTEDATTIDLERIELLPDALHRVPRALALRHDVLSVMADHNLLTVAVPDPSDAETIDRIRLATGMHVRALAAPRAAIRARLAKVYPDGVPALRNLDSPAIRALDEIHAEALRQGASDVHLEPLPEGGRVRQRVDGVLHEVQVLTTDVFCALASRVKLLAGMDIADRRQPQDGRYSIAAAAREVEARASSMPTIFGEKIVIRLLDHHTAIPSLAGLGIPEHYAQRYQHAIESPHGFIVVCGPTGSGKTTTLYASLAHRNSCSSNLCTVEDPVEIRIPGIAQVQVNPKAGVTFASALRGFLRQDPNVIMVGEMRDEETASVAAAASLSGQLVLTTVHAGSAVTAVRRLVELGVSRQVLGAGLTAVVAQRLVRRLCTHCRVPAPARGTFGIGAGTCTFAPGGCGRCGGSGYAGRTAIFEFAFIDRIAGELISSGGSDGDLLRHLQSTGFETMQSDGEQRVLAGQTSFDEISRVLNVDAA